jgi:hypothetical protein
LAGAGLDLRESGCGGRLPLGLLLMAVLIFSALKLDSTGFKSPFWRYFLSKTVKNEYFSHLNSTISLFYSFIPE